MKFFSNIKLTPLLFFIIIALERSPWFVFGIFSPLILKVPILLYLIFATRHQPQRFKVVLMIFVCLFYFVLLQLDRGIHLSSFLVLISIYLAGKLTEEDGNLIIKYFTNYLFLIIAISCPLWLMHTKVAPLPSYGFIDLTEMKGSVTMMDNHFFFLTSLGNEAYRFYSVFDEPGALGCMSALTLWANHFDFRNNKKLLVILIGTCFTYSLAFFVLTMVGWIYCSFKSFKSIIYSVVLFGIITFGMFYYMKDDLAFQRSLVERITEFDNETNGLNHRSSMELDYKYAELFKDTSFLFGKGEKYLNQFDTGYTYKNYICKYGFLGLFILLVCYYNLIIKRNKDALFTLFLFFLWFLQRPELFNVGHIVLFKSIVQNISFRKNLSINTL